jgi:L-aspartate oxidase
VLRDGAGTAVMTGAHPLGDLAPRDVVTRTMAAHMARLGADHLVLDATGLGAALLERRFPTVLRLCRQAGIDPVTTPVPVSPAAHYLMGGIRTGLDGRAGLPGLWAVGEAACTGVHGANRLASNSLLEGVVFAARIGRALEEGAEAVGTGAVDNPAHLPAEVGYAPPPGDPTAAGPDGGRPGPVAAGPAGAGRVAAGPGAGTGEVRARLRRLMTDRVGVVRSGSGLAEAVAELDRLAAALGAPWRMADLGGPGGTADLGGPGTADLGGPGPTDLGDPGPAAFEAANLVQLGRAVAELAARREESRGGHWRSDHPAPVEAWRVRQTLTRTASGDLEAGLLAVPAAVEAGR